MSLLTLKEFVRESNKIERIIREPTEEEVAELGRFIALPEVTINDLEEFVKVNQPNARLRDSYGLNVRVGNYYPPSGGPHIKEQLQSLLDNQHLYDSYTLHCKYQKIHPFTDGNGRSGRALWLHKHKDLSYGFLHMFYYQSLSHFRGN